MDAGRPSTTAMAVAVARDAHRSFDQPPWILDDPFALVLVGPAWRAIRASDEATFAEPARRQNRASIVVRSRYAEERLLVGPYRQYVMLGAGLDSFAWRRSDLVGLLRLFEVDHPATQAWKRTRIEEFGLPVQDSHVFAPVDFETETLTIGLDRAGFDWSAPSFVSWLGVTMYLSIDAIHAILTTISGCGPGSEIVFSYDVTDAFLDKTARDVLHAESSLVARTGEPYTTRLSPLEADALVEDCGLKVAEHLTREALYERYFARRHDGLCPSATERLIAARVPG